MFPADLRLLANHWEDWPSICVSPFRQSKKKRRQQDGKEKESGKKEKEPKKITDSKSQDRVAQLKSQDGPKRGHGADGGEHTVGKIGSGTDRPDSGLTNRAESAVADDGK